MSASSLRLDHLRQLVSPGVVAVMLLWKPFVMIQLTGLALVLAYFHYEPVTRACEWAGDVKARWGILFAMVTMPIACGVVPELFKVIAGVDRTWSRERASLMLHNMVLFCVGGVCVDLFYTALGSLLGDSRSPLIVMAKVLIDQLVYSPIVGVPLISLAYTLRRAGYLPQAAAGQLGLGWYVREVGPVLVTCWAYWFPMTTLMYTLPPKLTFVYGLVASAASATLLTAVAGRGREARMGDAHT